MLILLLLLSRTFVEFSEIFESFGTKFEANFTNFKVDKKHSFQPNCHFICALNKVEQGSKNGPGGGLGSIF